MAAAVKLLVFGLSEFIDIDDIFSARATSKDECFRIIQSKYGPNTSYVAIGDGAEEETAARNTGMPFIAVRSKRDLDTVCTALDLSGGAAL